MAEHRKEKRFVSVHLRVPVAVQQRLAALAEYDATRQDRVVYISELARAAMRRYIVERATSDPGVAAVLHGVD